MNRLSLLIALFLALSVAAEMEYRSYEGTGNNRANPTWGAANTAFIKNFPVNYVDGYWKMDPNLPNARDLSDALFGTKPSDGGNSKTKKSNFYCALGMIAMYDIARGAYGTGAGYAANIPVGDNVVFNPRNISGTTMTFNRQACQPSFNTSAVSGDPCRQRLLATSFLDLSGFYGVNSVQRSTAMETDANLIPTGRLRTVVDSTYGEMMPFNNATQSFYYPANSGTFPIADAIIAVLVREHNRLAAKIKAAKPELTGAQVFEEARRWTIAYYQSIIFNEFYPATIGEEMPSYRGYQDTVDSTTSAEFFTAGARYGMSEVPPVIERLGEDGLTIPDGNLIVRDVYRKPKVYFSAGIEPVIRGAFSTLQQEVDLYHTDDVRLWAYVTPPTPPRDAVALSIQRARDLGLPNYNQLRTHIGLPIATSFEEITSDPTTLAALRKWYPGGVNSLDYYVGVLAEDHPGKHLGPSLRTIFKEQFLRLRDGDRFYYKSADAGFTAAEIAEIENTKLSTLVLRNTNIKSLPCSLLYMTGVSDCGNAFEQGYKGMEGNASLIGGAYSLSWKILEDRRSVKFTIKANTTGWVAFAVPKTAKRMEGSDIVAGWVDGSTGAVTVEEYWARSKERCDNGKGVCKKAANSTRITGISGYEANGETVISFTRPIAAAGANGEDGLALGFGLIDINVAFGMTDGPLSYHGGNKEAAKLTILPPGGFEDPPTPKTSDVRPAASAKPAASTAAPGSSAKPATSAPLPRRSPAPGSSPSHPADPASSGKPTASTTPGRSSAVPQGSRIVGAASSSKSCSWMMLATLFAFCFVL